MTGKGMQKNGRDREFQCMPRRLMHMETENFNASHPSSMSVQITLAPQVQGQLREAGEPWPPVSFK